MSVNLGSSAMGSIPSATARSNASSVSKNTSATGITPLPHSDKREANVTSVDASLASLPVADARLPTDLSAFRQVGGSATALDQRYALLGGVSAPSPRPVPPEVLESFASSAFESTLMVIDNMARAHLDRLPMPGRAGGPPATAFEYRFARFLSAAEKTLVDLARRMRETELPTPPSVPMQRLLNVASASFWRANPAEGHEADASSRLHPVTSTGPRDLGVTPDRSEAKLASGVPDVIKSQQAPAPIHLQKMAEALSKLRAARSDSLTPGAGKPTDTSRTIPAFAGGGRESARIDRTAADDQ